MRPVLAPRATKSPHHCQISLRCFSAFCIFWHPFSGFNGMNEMQFLLNLKRARRAEEVVGLFDLALTRCFIQK